ncbi:TPA: hypothetical protein ACHTCC_003076 [Citrobacter freundii]
MSSGAKAVSAATAALTVQVAQRYPAVIWRS